MAYTKLQRRILTHTVTDSEYSIHEIAKVAYDGMVIGESLDIVQIRQAVEILVNSGDLLKTVIDGEADYLNISPL